MTESTETSRDGRIRGAGRGVFARAGPSSLGGGAVFPAGSVSPIGVLPSAATAGGVPPRLSAAAKRTRRSRRGAPRRLPSQSDAPLAVRSFAMVVCVAQPLPPGPQTTRPPVSEPVFAAAARGSAERRRSESCTGAVKSPPGRRVAENPPPLRLPRALAPTAPHRPPRAGRNAVARRSPRSTRSPPF